MITPGCNRAFEILDDDLAGQSGDLVELLPHGGARGGLAALGRLLCVPLLHDVHVLHLAGELREDRVVYGSHSTRTAARLHPWRRLVRLDLDLDLGPVDDGIPLALRPRSSYDHDLAVAVGDHQVAVPVSPRCGGCGTAPPPRSWPRAWLSTRPLAVPPMWKVRMVSWVPGSPMDWAAMMPTASPSSDQAARGQVAAVALDADPALGLAGQDRPDPHPLDDRSPRPSGPASSVILVGRPAR